MHPPAPTSSRLEESITRKVAKKDELTTRGKRSSTPFAAKPQVVKVTYRILFLGKRGRGAKCHLHRRQLVFFGHFSRKNRTSANRVPSEERGASATTPSSAIRGLPQPDGCVHTTLWYYDKRFLRA